MEAEPLVLRHHHEPLPSSEAGVLARLKQVIGLSHVDEIRITPTGLEVSRRVLPGAEVLPDGPSSDLDPEFLLERIELVESGVPGTHPYLLLAAAMSVLASRGLQPVVLVAPPGGLLAALFGLDESAGDVTHFMGVATRYTHESAYQEKVVVVGSPSRFLEDATVGVMIDIGA